MYKLLSGLLLIIPSFVEAHTRWFAYGELEPVTDPNHNLYLSVWAVIIVFVVCIGIYLHQKNIFRLSFLRPSAKHAYDRAASTFAMVSGTFLLIAGTHEYLFSPNLNLESGISYSFLVLEIIIGIAFILGIGTRTSALMLALMWLLLFPTVGAVSALEDIWVLSTALFILIMGNDYFSLIGFTILGKVFRRFRPYALSILRLGTGVTLMVLGFSEKILAPELGLNFLKQYDWNFMSQFGFSDYLFTISAGAVEFTLGLVFVLGIVTRLNALVTAIIFTIPLFILGPIELAGHIPHFAAVILLLLFGNGGKFLIFKSYNDARVK